MNITRLLTRLFEKPAYATPDQLSIGGAWIVGIIVIATVIALCWGLS